LIQLDWQGYYLDGKTAEKQDVHICLLHEGLKITAKNGTVFVWPYQDMRQTQGFYGNEPVQLERGGKFPEILIIKDSAFLTSLHNFAPQPARRFHDPAFRRLRVRLTAYAAIGIVVAIVFLYLWGIPLTAKIITPHIPMAWEKGLGASALNILAPEESRCQDPELERAIREMVERLKAVDDGPYAYRVFVTQSPIFNAVALPGGNIVIFRGLLEKTDSPEALAAVVAHEMQHIKNRHATQRIIKDSSTGLILSAISGDVTGALLYGAKAASNLAMLSYSRQDEEEADAAGIKMLIDARLDPAAMIRFFAVMEQHGGKSHLPQYLSTHPDMNERIERLKSLIRKAEKDRPAYTKLASGDNWNRIKKSCTPKPQP
jgi:predicted Zn-dependent protease